MKKVAACLLCALMVLGIGGCSDKYSEEKETEQILSENGYWIDATNSGVAIKKYYENENFEYWVHTDKTKSKIAYNNKTLLGKYGSIDPINGDLITNILTDEEGINFTDDFISSIKKKYNSSLKKMNLTAKQLLKYMNYKMEHDPNSVENENAFDNTDDDSDDYVIKNDVLKYYTLATTITVDDLYMDNFGAYAYGDISFITEDCEAIDKSYNTDGLVPQGAFYRKMSTSLEGFSRGFNDGSKFSKHLLGFSTNSKDEFQPYADDLLTYVVRKDSLKPVMTKFSTLSSIDGSFDFDTNSYEFTIKDLSTCAKELKISEEMLGYILAMLDEYAPTVSFNGNSYSFKLN